MSFSRHLINKKLYGITSIWLASMFDVYFVRNNYMLEVFSICIFLFFSPYCDIVPCPDLFGEIPLSDNWGNWRGKSVFVCLLIKQV